MKLRVNYRIEETGEMKVADIKNVRIITRADQERVEQLIAKKLNYDKVTIFNWKIIGKMQERLGEKGNGRK